MASGTALDCVPDSDEDSRGTAQRRDADLTDAHQEEVFSDEEEEAQPLVHSALWRPVPCAALQPHNALPGKGTQQQQQQHGGPHTTAFTRCKPTQPVLLRQSSRSGAARFQRCMKTAAAVEADRVQTERAAAAADEMASALNTACEPPTMAGTSEAGGGDFHLQQLPSMQHLPLQAATAPAACPAGSASFLKRAVLPRGPNLAEKLTQQQLQASPHAAAEDASPVPTHSPPVNASAGRAAAHQRQQVDSMEVHERQHKQEQLLSAQGHAPDGQPTARSGAPSQPFAAASTAAAPPTATLHRTADGLNVVMMSRQAQSAAPLGTEGSTRGSQGRGKAEGLNSGWGNNFVRIDLKKGRGSTKYLTKHGSKRRKRAGNLRGSRWQTPRMRQVGDGADFLEGWQGSRVRCFKCGGSGHYARDCTAEQQAHADMAALCSGSSGEEDGDGTPTAAPMMHSAATAAAANPQQPRLRAGSNASAPSGFVGGGLSSAGAPASPVTDPAEQYAAVLAEPSEEALTGVLRNVFGHAAFRGLQLVTVQQLLSGSSLLSIMPTGMGKSLCYQLPALLLPGLTLVVSPLIALMHDQAASVPPPLTAAVLWSGQSRADALQVLADVAAGRVKVLFVSPERLNNPHLLEALRPRMPLPLVVVDEAHCVAEWGHSFRPAYFRLGAALMGDVRAQRIMALTATATRPTEAAIRQVLRIPAENVLRDAAVRQNLRLQVLRTMGGGSSQATRDRICSLFCGSGALAGVRCAIVYCAFKEDANQLARLLSARGVCARAYHAGKDYRERSATEADFAAGRIRVVAATVAFGMGINLTRVEAVVHATLPRSLEEYVQQVGRAGRDGSEAQCVALVDDADFVRLRSLAFSGVLDLAAVRGFLEAVFSPVAQGQKHYRLRQCSKTAAEAGGKAMAHHVGRGSSSNRSKKRKAAAGALLDVSSEEECVDVAAPEAHPEPGRQKGSMSRRPACAANAAEQQADGDAAGEEAGPAALRQFGVLAVKKLAAELDMREESMESILSYLEADAHPCLRMLPATALSVKVSFYAAPAEQMAVQNPVVQSVLEACPNPRNGVYNAPAARLAAAAQKAPGLVLQELREMAAGSLIGFELSREEGPAYEILYTPPNLDSLAQQVHTRLAAVLACQVMRLDVSYRSLMAAVRGGQTAACKEEQQAGQEAALRAAVERYFEETSEEIASKAITRGGGAELQSNAGDAGGGDSTASALQLDTQGLPLKRAEPALLQAARAVLRRNREQAGPALSPRALARILHGVGSPAFPPDTWSKRMGAFWGSQAHVDFAAVLKAAEIVVRGDNHL